MKESVETTVCTDGARAAFAEFQRQQRLRNKALTRSWNQLDPGDVFFEIYDKDKVPPKKCTRASINKRLRHLKQHNKYRPLLRTTFIQ